MRVAGSNKIMKRSMLFKLCIAAVVLAAGTITQFNCAGALAGVNPCGTILSLSFCDPVAYSQLYGNYWNTNFDADPTCAIPFQCGETTNP
jgi:hypothetical protein